MGVGCEASRAKEALGRTRVMCVDVLSPPGTLFYPQFLYLHFISELVFMCPVEKCVHGTLPSKMYLGAGNECGFVLEYLPSMYGSLTLICIPSFQVLFAGRHI